MMMMQPGGAFNLHRAGGGMLPGTRHGGCPVQPQYPQMNQPHNPPCQNPIAAQSNSAIPNQQHGANPASQSGPAITGGASNFGNASRASDGWNVQGGPRPSVNVAQGMGPGMMPIKLDTPESLAMDWKKAKMQKRKAKYRPYSKSRQDTLYYIEDEILSKMKGLSTVQMQHMLPKDSDYNFWSSLWAFMTRVEQDRILVPALCDSFREFLQSEQEDEANARKAAFEKFKNTYGQLNYDYCKQGAGAFIYTDIDFYLLLHGFRDDGIDVPGSFERKLGVALNYLKTSNRTPTPGDDISMTVLQETLNLLEDKSTGACRCSAPARR